MNERESGNPRSDSATDGAGVEVTPERWLKIKELLIAAENIYPGDRDAFLREACGSDQNLQAEVQSLLAADDGGVESRFSATGLLCEAGLGPAQADPMVGRRVSSYEVVQRIGHGGMALVYRAVRADDAYRKQVAIKIVRVELDRAEVLNRFRNERHTLAGLDHPNIVRLIDGGSTTEGLPYLVMDHIEGTPIDEYCDSHELPIDKRLRLFCTVCAAVQYAHQNLVVHRDLKPSNILVTAEGVPKLLDFGIAKVLHPDPSTQALRVTQTGTRRMTPAYASPEQVRGEPVTPASDIYSLGVVLYELLTGHRPYKLKEPTPGEMEQAICEQEPENPSTAVNRVETETLPDGTTVSKTPELVSKTREGELEKLRRCLRGDLDNIVLMTLHKVPKRRYLSIRDLAEDIQRHLDHLPVRARRSTLTYRTSKFVRRHTVEMIAAAMILAVLLGAAGFTFWADRRATERVRAELNSQRSRGRRSVAVLGFKNLSGRPEAAWLSTALSEMLTTELAAGGKLRTIPGDDVAQARINLSLPDSDTLSKTALGRIYKNLGSDYVVLGSYLDIGDAGRNVRLDLQVRDAALGETVTAVVESGSETALPELVTRAGTDLRAKLGIPEISPAESASAQASLPSKPEAARFYAEGVSRLRVYDAVAARDPLQKAISVEPEFALAHAALADAWAALGYDEKAQQEAKRAFDLSGGLSREDRLAVEARYRETTHEWNRVVQIYRVLFEFFPDNIEYGLKLVSAQVKAGQAKDALPTIDALHRLPFPLRDDPRIDLGEADVAGFLSDSNQARAALTRALENSASRGQGLLMAQARLAQGKALLSSGELARALQAFETAHNLFVKHGDENGSAHAVNRIATTYWLQGDLVQAKQKYEEALSSYRASGNQEGIANELDNIGNILDNQGELESAKMRRSESLAIFRRIDDRLGIADTLNNLANVLDEQGGLSDARQMFEESLEIYRGIADKHGVAMVLSNIGGILYEQGDLTGAIKFCNESLKMQREIGDKHGMPRLLSTLGEIHLSQGRLVEAGKEQDLSFAIRKETGEKEGQAESELDLALLAVEKGRFPEAEALAKRAMDEFRRDHEPDIESYTQAVLAQILVAEGKSGESLEMITRAAQSSQKITKVGVRLQTNIAVARARTASSGYSDPAELAEARKALEATLAEAAKYGYLEYQLDARLAMGEIQAKSGNVSAGRVRLANVEREAKVKGFGLIAHKALIARGQHDRFPDQRDGPAETIK